MFQKYYKVELVTLDNQRITVHMEGNKIQDIVLKLKGNRLSFIPKSKEDLHSFTLYTHTISRIQYSVVTDIGYGGKFLIYDVYAD